MDLRKLASLSKTVIVLFMATSLLVFSFAHRPVPSAADLAKADYVASFGLTLDALCGLQSEDGDGLGTGDCPVCQLSSVILVPEVSGSQIGTDLRAADLVLPLAQVRSACHPTNPAAPVRAPPVA